jgi:hypothetical protein
MVATPADNPVSATSAVRSLLSVNVTEATVARFVGSVNVTVTGDEDGGSAETVTLP